MGLCGPHSVRQVAPPDRLEAAGRGDGAVQRGVLPGERARLLAGGLPHLRKDLFDYDCLLLYIMFICCRLDYATVY